MNSHKLVFEMKTAMETISEVFQPAGILSRRLREVDDEGRMKGTMTEVRMGLEVRVELDGDKEKITGR